MAAVASLLLPTTPLDYHRIVSPSLRIPSDVTVPVGILACQRDPYLRQLDTKIVSCAVSDSRESATNKSKKAVIVPTLPKGPLLEVILQDTVIFPEGGGQPTDTGIIVTVDGTVFPVVQCKRSGGFAVHYVQAGESKQAALSALASNTTVSVQLDQQGYERRYDHMSMHTSQHLLSALLETRLNIPTLSWSMTASPEPCYVEIPRGMTTDEILAIQTEANRLVFEGRRIHVEVGELEPTSNNPEVTSSGREIGRGIPTDYTGGVKRIVVIDGLDRNPCCGTHLPSLHNLQLFILPHTEALSRSTTTTARLYFLAGPRLITHLTSVHSSLSVAASSLSCHMKAVPDRVTQIIQERKRSEKRVEDLEQEIAASLSTELIQLTRDSLVSQKPGTIFKKHLHRCDDGGKPLAFLSAISNNFTRAINTINPPPSYLLVLTSSPSSQTTNSTTLVMIVGSDPEHVKTAGDLFERELKAKGGGQGLKWSGKFTGVWRQSKEATIVTNSLSSIGE